MICGRVFPLCFPKLMLVQFIVDSPFKDMKDAYSSALYRFCSVKIHDRQSVNGLFVLIVQVVLFFVWDFSDYNIGRGACISNLPPVESQVI